MVKLFRFCVFLLEPNGTVACNVSVAASRADNSYIMTFEDEAIAIMWCLSPITPNY